MIEPDETIVSQHSLAEWDQKARADLKSSRKGQRVPKEFKADFSGYSPVAARWKRQEHAPS